MTRRLSVLAPIAEKGLWSFVQGALVFFLGAGALDWNNTQAAVAAGTASVVSFLLATVSATAIPSNLTFYQDLGLRIVRSAGAAFLAALLVDPQMILAGESWKSAASAAGMAVLVILKGGAARFIGNPSSAATLPAGKDPVPDENGEFEPADDEKLELGDIPIEFYGE